jgi:hypothetical protein
VATTLLDQRVARCPAVVQCLHNWSDCVSWPGWATKQEDGLPMFWTADMVSGTQSKSRIVKCWHLGAPYEALSEASLFSKF